MSLIETGQKKFKVQNFVENTMVMAILKMAMCAVSAPVLLERHIVKIPEQIFPVKMPDYLKKAVPSPTWGTF